MPEQTPLTSAKPLSVSQALNIAKEALESCTLTLVGEVSEVSNKPGYKAVYFTVKDEGASLPAMMWMNRFRSAGVDLRVGMLVQLTGRFTLYAPKGRMNFDVFSLALTGEGDLRQKVAALAKKLQSEGLMDPANKRPVPTYPTCIGLVTSPRGAAVHDVLRTLRRRFPLAQVLLAGVGVEGAQAPADLASGIQAVTNAGAEVVLLVRGGGSFEDLMPFNDEVLARTIAANPVPVVTGIGHEPDTSIADMVADRRASTPTAAAESVVPDLYDLQASLAATQARMIQIVDAAIKQANQAWLSYATRPVFADPSSLFATEAQSLDVYQDRLQRAIPYNIMRDSNTLAAASIKMRAIGATLLDRFEHQLARSAARLDDLSPLAVLSRGYALAKDATGSLVASVNAVEAGDALVVTVADGSIACTVESTTYADETSTPWKDD